MKDPPALLRRARRRAHRAITYNGKTGQQTKRLPLRLFGTRPTTRFCSALGTQGAGLSAAAPGQKIIVFSRMRGAHNVIANVRRWASKV